MRPSLVLAALLFGASCKQNISADQELCAKAAAMFEKCEDFSSLGSGSDVPLTKELMIDRWRGLCRAVRTGKTDMLMKNTLELYKSLDDEAKAMMRTQAECAVKATTCAEYQKCNE